LASLSKPARPTGFLNFNQTLQFLIVCLQQEK
jgi:hypothetical protein